MKVSQYQEKFESEWNAFVGLSKNGNFLFNRTYMSYHADRFKDSSLMFRDEKDNLIALLPATSKGDLIVSHGGLTYGGLITDGEMKTGKMLVIFNDLISFAKSAGYSKILYKAIPHIFHKIPSEEDLYALYVNGAKLVRRDASSVIELNQRRGFSKGKRENIKKSHRAGILVSESKDYDRFFRIGEEVLSDRHNTMPVHSSAEMRYLADNFPENIKLFGAFVEDRMLAGVLIYEFVNSVHTQYMFNSDEGLNVGALDAVLGYLINQVYFQKTYFSFGISTENNGLNLNEGLIQQKEMFGARTIIHDFYEICF